MGLPPLKALIMGLKAYCVKTNTKAMPSTVGMVTSMGGASIGRCVTLAMALQGGEEAISYSSFVKVTRSEGRPSRRMFRRRLSRVSGVIFSSKMETDHVAGSAITVKASVFEVARCIYMES